MARNFNSALDGLPEYKEITRALLDGKAPVCVSGCVDSERAHLAAEFTDRKKNVLLLTCNEVQARELCEDAQVFLAEDPLLFPARDLLFADADISGSLLSRQRMVILRDLLEKKGLFVVSTIDALLDRMAAPAYLRSECQSLKPGSFQDVTALCRKLVSLGYTREGVVTVPGEFALRGGILDIFLLTEENPVRIEFWDDEIDSIRSFDAETQRSLENLEEVRIYPIAEAGGGEASLLDYFSADDFFVLDEPERMKEKAEAVASEYQESMLRRMEAAADKGGAIPPIHDPAALWKAFGQHRVLILTGLDYRNNPLVAGHHFSVEAHSLHSYGGNFDLMISDLQKWKREKYSVVLLSGSRSRAGRLAMQLTDYDIPAFFAEESGKLVRPGQVLVTYGNIHKSFIYPSLRFAVISEGDLFGRAKRKHKRKYSGAGQRLHDITELNVGDYVVHEDHGLGIYQGIEKKIIDHIEKDYLKITYKDGGNLYTPVTQMNRVEKYASADADPAPRLNKLGGTEWQATKTKVKKAVGAIAKDLVELYAKRQRAAGFIYGPDTVWQREFEEQFPYEETEDQLKAIEAVKADMEAGRVMDRLVCGDVGFGKTEIAIRAAFKAVQESKQVAYLVPTTILAQQHYNSFAERMKEYPIRVGLLSRFRTAAQQKATVEELKKGACDIVIGTHRLLSKDVSFKDLGLLIIDEEQRFGVSDKEKIKKLKENVNVMSLTATPIPRTLHMSMIGIRDMSVLEEPPLDRLPIQTYVAEYNDEIAREAIVRELARGGQVYFVYNKVKDIEQITAHLQSLVPDAEIAYAHGQMKERELEEIMFEFINGEIDVLVSTTIIETGLDIPNVNTIIIQDSDRYGLSQLYQLRGRVGRSNRTSYAFLFYKGGRLLKDVAEKRLQAIREYTELGSGVRISMRDLEIRGAGNLLGAEQHGHMEAVGYELYCKMLGTAVREIKGEKEDMGFDTVLDLPMDANIPPEYITNENQKMDIYRRIASIRNEEDYEDMQDELIDRFGTLPKPVDHLLRIALLRTRAHALFITEITGGPEHIQVRLLNHAPADSEELVKAAMSYRGAMKLRGGENPGIYLTLRPGQITGADSLLRTVSDLLDRLEPAFAGANAGDT